MDDGSVSSRSDPSVMMIVMSDRVSEEEREEIFHSLETIWGSHVIKKGLVKNCKRCQPAVNEVSFVAH